VSASDKAEPATSTTEPTRPVTTGPKVPEGVAMSAATPPKGISVSKGAPASKGPPAPVSQGAPVSHGAPPPAPGFASSGAYSAAETDGTSGNGTARKPAFGPTGAYTPPSVSAPSMNSPVTTAAASEPAGKPLAAPAQPIGEDDVGGPRRVRLTVSSVDPFSVMKLSFLLSVAAGVALVVATIVVWSVLDGMGVFDGINRTLTDIAGTESKVSLIKYTGFGRVVSIATVVAVVDVLIITAMCTVSAILYNISAGLVGGLRVTLSDD
jgi:hypothetical protein